MVNMDTWVTVHWAAIEGDLPSYGEQLVRMLIALGAILLALLLVAKLLPRWLGRRDGEVAGSANMGDGLDVVSVRCVDPRTKVVLVRAGSEHVLFAVTDAGAVRLASGPALDPEFAEVGDGGARPSAPREGAPS